MNKEKKPIDKEKVIDIIKNGNEPLKSEVMLNILEDLKSEEKEARAAQYLCEMIIDTIRESFVILDSGLKVISANKSFYTTFKVTPKETEGKLIYELGNRQWDIPRLRELLESILPKKKFFNDFRVEHKFQTIGKKVMLLNARRIDDLQKILLAFEDITEK